MGLFNFLNNRVQKVERNSHGDWFYQLYGANAHFTRLSQGQKLQAMLLNPALAKIVFLNCDVFSLAQIKRKDGKEDELVKLLKKPNYFQTQRQFLWNYRFWLMFGSSYLRAFSNKVDGTNQNLYWLDPTKIQWDEQLLNKVNKHVFSKNTLKEILKSKVSYDYGNSKTNIELSEIKAFHDLTNSFDNWFVGLSRIDAIYKILDNIDSGLHAKKVNLKFSQKFAVSGSYNPEKDLTGFTTMQDIEKDNLETRLLSNKHVHAIKSQINIQRFVNDLAKLKLDDSYNEDLAKVGGIYNIPEEILGALKKGSTYENQQKAIGRYVEFSEMPKANDFLEGLCQFFDLDVSAYEISFNNNSFMQAFEQEKSDALKTKVETLKILIDLGADKNKSAELLGLNLEFK